MLEHSFGCNRLHLFVAEIFSVDNDLSMVYFYSEQSNPGDCSNKVKLVYADRLELTLNVDAAPKLQTSGKFSQPEGIYLLNFLQDILII